jgi:hypothetical protein
MIADASHAAWCSPVRRFRSARPVAPNCFRSADHLSLRLYNGSLVETDVADIN